MIEFIREKSYYLLGGTVILIILIVIIAGCSNKKSGYGSIEDKMIKAAASYYANRKNGLPKIDGDTVDVDINTLIEAKLLKEVKDPKDKNNTCSGHVTVTNVDGEYDYMPYLYCEGNYELKKLSDIVKSSEVDEYGNGVYEINDSYVYRGDELDNYVSFDGYLWRIVSMNQDGVIRIVRVHDSDEEEFTYDDRYNSEVEENYGITDDFLYTEMRKTLSNYYKDLDTDIKAHLVKSNICVGSVGVDQHSSDANECAQLEKNMYVGLLRMSDYENASLDQKCLNFNMFECTNRNYLATTEVKSWLLTKAAENNYQVYYLSDHIIKRDAVSYEFIAPVLSLKNNTYIEEGKGTLDEPYVIK